MRANEQTIQELLSGEVVYVTPTFQHPYNGSETLVEQMLAAALATDGRPCLLGALVTRELARHDAFRKTLLVDGNQRLATLLMMLLALRNALRGPQPDEAERLDAACFLNTGAPPHARFKNLVGKRDRAAFEGGVAGDGFPDAAHPLARAHALAAAAFADLPTERLLAIARRMLGEFTFIVFALAPDDDPYPLFRLFNQTDDESTRIGLDTYRQFGSDPELMDLIAGGENQEVEFKAHAIVPGRRTREDGAPQGVGSVVRAVAAMLNSTSGGTILIGVEDDGAICGVEGEYALADGGKANWDGWLLKLVNTLRARLGARNTFLHYAIERRQAGVHDVCMIRVEPSDEPVYIDKRLFVRTLNQTVEMLGPDLVDYVSRRFRDPAGIQTP